MQTLITIKTSAHSSQVYTQSMCIHKLVMHIAVLCVYTGKAYDDVGHTTMKIVVAYMYIKCISAMVWRLPLIYDALLLHIHISTMSTHRSVHFISYPKHNVIMWLKPRWKAPSPRPCLSGFVFVSRACNALLFR